MTDPSLHSRILYCDLCRVSYSNLKFHEIHQKSTVHVTRASIVAYAVATYITDYPSLWMAEDEDTISEHEGAPIKVSDPPHGQETNPTTGQHDDGALTLAWPQTPSLPDSPHAISGKKTPGFPYFDDIFAEMDASDSETFAVVL